MVAGRPAVRRDNNFDALRLVAAATVIFSHAFLLATGNEDQEPLVWITGVQCNLGLVGVFIFFAISGYLVTESFERSASPLDYLAKRALRIFPGLFVVLLAAAFLIAPIVTSLPVADYLRRPEVYGYVVGNTLLNLTIHELPGTLFMNNSAGLEVNGSLWTLRYEFMMYLLVMLLGMLRLLRPSVIAALLVAGLGCLQWKHLDLLGSWGGLLGFFAIGMLLYKLRDRSVLDGRIALLALAGLVASSLARQFIQLFPLFGGYLAIYLAFDRRLPKIAATRFGDLSYGLYLFGWPIEALVMHLSGGTARWWQLFLISLPLATLAALLSWRLVEGPMLQLKPRRRAASVSAPSAPAPGLRRPDRLPPPEWR
jgi:peptidoglycan/LPS O-acetylase OafA/YrhL